MEHLRSIHLVLVKLRRLRPDFVQLNGHPKTDVPTYFGLASQMNFTRRENIHSGARLNKAEWLSVNESGGNRRIESIRSEASKNELSTKPDRLMGLNLPVAHVHHQSVGFRPKT